MEFNWESKNYRDLVDQYLGHRNKRRPRGAVQALAKAVGCHSTFIAQVLKERAQFSAEQGFEVCQFFQFNPDQQDYFLLLLARDRAANLKLKYYYQKKLDNLLEQQRDLKPAESSGLNTSGAYEAEYFGNWAYQTVHALTQITRTQTIAAIAKVVKLSHEDVKDVLKRLEIMGLVKYEKSTWQSTLNSLHLAKESRFIRQLHTTWKAKLISDIQTGAISEGTRFSGLVTVTEKDYQRIRNILVAAIGTIRKTVEASTSEEACILSIDCYKI